MPYREGERVLVPDPLGQGKVEAVMVVVAKLSDQRRFAWVRYIGGPEPGASARVDYLEIEPAT